MMMVARNFIRIRAVLPVCRRTFTNGKTCKNVIGSGLPDLEIPELTLPEFFEPYLEKFEKFTATECCETKREYTYGEINKKSKTLARATQKFLGLNDGDVVAVILSNIPEYPIANLAILRANLLITTVSPMFTSDEISRQLIDANAKLVITQQNIFEKVSDAIRKTSRKVPVMVIKTKNGQELPNNTINFHELVNTEIDHPDKKPCNPGSTAVLLYSSGTTGLPKGVQLTHKNVISNLLQFSHPDIQFLDEASGRFQEVYPTTLPLYHTFGYNLIMSYLTLYGGRTVLLEKFSLKSYITLLQQYPSSTVLCLVPPLVLMLINNESIKKEYLRNVKLAFSGAAPLSQADEQRFIQKFGDHLAFAQGYGLTEATSASSFLFPKIRQSKQSSQGSVGIPMANSQMKFLEIDKPNSAPLGARKIGELYIKGPHVMKGYLGRPQETKSCLTEDGWLRTGDVGYYNEEGLVFVTDRFKELIKVKGHQVPPAELEGVIRSYPGVLEAAVIGIPHETSGEVPRCYLVQKKGVTVDVKRLNEYVSERVAKYKELKGGVAIVDEIPKSPSGKILRRKLKEEFLKGGGE